MNFIRMDLAPGKPEPSISQTNVNIFLNIICGNKDVNIRPVASAKPANKQKVLSLSQPIVKKPGAVSLLWVTNSSKQERNSPNYKIVHPANIKTGKRPRMLTRRPFFF